MLLARNTEMGSMPGEMKNHNEPDHPGFLTIDGLSVTRGNKTVLQDISLSIRPGTITAIVGPSGAGKSTLLATLNGLLRPADGSITVRGIGALSSNEALRQHRLRTSTIFQEHALIDRLSALENVLLGLAETRNPISLFNWPAQHKRKAAKALEKVGLLHLAHNRTGSLSGGERQRVGIARALVRAPQLLLGDEPFSAIDPALAQNLGNEFRSLSKAMGITVILVLHQIDIARTLADRIIGLSHGTITFDSTASNFDCDAHNHLFAIPSSSPEYSTPR